MKINTKQEAIALIERYRKELNISQREMASKLNINTQTYSSNIKGHTEMSLDTLFNIMGVLGLNLSIED